MNLNKVFLVGRLGDDPTERETAKGETVINFPLATNSGWGDNIKTDWHKVVAFGKLATGVSGSGISKGQEILVEGRISYGKYTDRNGVERKSSDIIASKIEYGSRPKGGGGNDEQMDNTGDPNIPF